MGRVGATARPSAPQHALEHLDVVVIGAGISGIGAGRYLATDLPGTSFAIRSRSVRVDDQSSAARSAMLVKDAVSLCNELCDRYQGLPKKEKLHTERMIFPRAAIYL